MYTLDSKGKILAHFKKIDTGQHTMLVRTGVDKDPDPDQIVEEGWCVASTSRNAGMGTVKWLMPDDHAPIEDNLERLKEELFNLGYRENRRGRWVAK